MLDAEALAIAEPGGYQLLYWEVDHGPAKTGRRCFFVIPSSGRSGMHNSRMGRRYVDRAVTDHASESAGLGAGRLDRRIPKRSLFVSFKTLWNSP